MSQCLQIWLRLSSHCFAEHRGAGTSGTSSPIRGRYLEAGAETPTTRHINLHLPSPTNVTPSPVGEGEQHPLSPPPSCRRMNVTPYTDTGPVPRGRARQPPQPSSLTNTPVPPPHYRHPRRRSGISAGHGGATPIPRNRVIPRNRHNPLVGAGFKPAWDAVQGANPQIPATHPFTSQNTVRPPRSGGCHTRLG